MPCAVLVRERDSGGFPRNGKSVQLFLKPKNSEPILLGCPRRVCQSQIKSNLRQPPSFPWSQPGLDGWRRTDKGRSELLFLSRSLGAYVIGRFCRASKSRSDPPYLPARVQQCSCPGRPS